MSEGDIRRAVSLRRALVQGFREAYDRLGYVVVATILWFAAVSAVFGAMSLVVAVMPLIASVWKMLLLVPVALVGFMGAVGVFYYANRVVFRHDPSAIETFAGIGKLFWPGLKLFLLDGAITVVLLVDCAFFLAMAGRGVGFLALAVLSIYMMLMWLALAMYHLPLLAAQIDMESGPGAVVVLRKSVLLTLDNPGFTVGLFLVIIAITVLAVLPALIGMVLFFLGVIAFVLTHALRELFTKYGIVEPEPETVADDGWGASPSQGS